MIGAKEAAEGQVALRLRGGRQMGAMAAEEVVGRIGGVVGARRVELW